jgi:hypothetical protein
MKPMPARPLRPRLCACVSFAAFAGLAGLAVLTGGCELVAGIQDISLTGSPDAGVTGSIDATSDPYGNGTDATANDPGSDAASSLSDGGPGLAGDATMTGDPDGNGAGDTSSPGSPDAMSSREAGSPGTAGSDGGDSSTSGGAGPDATVDSGAGTASNDAGNSLGQPDGAAPTLVLIDDMEGTNPSAGWLDGPLVTGTWFTFDDGTDGGVLTPAPTAGAAAIIALLEATHVTYNGKVSAHAAHVTANDGFTSYGDGEGFNVNVAMGTVPQPYDASAYDGFVFWARSLTGALGTRFNVMDVNTTSPGSGGVCDGGVCNGFFGFDFGKAPWPALTSEWQMYVVRFEDLTRPVWAVDDPGLVFDPTQMIGCQFQLAEGTAADIWIDDVYFIKK